MQIPAATTIYRHDLFQKEFRLEEDEECELKNRFQSSQKLMLQPKNSKWQYRTMSILIEFLFD